MSEVGIHEKRAQRVGFRIRVEPEHEKNAFACFDCGASGRCLGAYADVLIWDVNPLENNKLIEDESKLELIVKDGVIHKNTTVPSSDDFYRPAPEYAIGPQTVTKGENAL